ncbi:hypothetical protein NPIL_458151 [Nephila pilipes]|uniref:Uncharacterized protein n=1 Tax=Nephila pilipes TaxID=299642 RepID=A0A8X6TFG5_NEPPI|nr:hypothetical protein NPIL_458151 [Nephila pilipes]
MLSYENFLQIPIAYNRSEKRKWTEGRQSAAGITKADIPESEKLGISFWLQALWYSNDKISVIGGFGTEKVEIISPDR